MSSKNAILLLATILFFSCGDGQNGIGNKDPQKTDNSKVQSNKDDRDEWQNTYKVLDLWSALLPGKRVMEIGANDGYWSYKLAQKGAYVIAADFSQARLDAIMEGAKAKGLEDKIETRLITTSDPMLQPGEMDIVWAVNMFSVLPNRAEYFAKVHRGLKVDGQLVLIDWLDIQTPHGPPVMERINGNNAFDDMDRAGFADVTLRTNLMPEQWIMVAQNVPPEAYQ